MKTFNVNGVQIKAKNKFEAIKKYKDSQINDSQLLDKLIDSLEKTSLDLTKSITNDEEKTVYKKLYDLTQNVIVQAEKEISSAKDENAFPAKESIANKLLILSKTLENNADKARNNSAKSKLIALAKEIYRCYDRNRKYKDSVEDSINDSIYETLKSEIGSDSVEHTADYLWTWEENMTGFDPVQVITDSDKVEHTKTNAMSLLNVYYLELKKEVEKKLKNGYKVKMSRINSSKYLTDSINDSTNVEDVRSEQNLAGMFRWWNNAMKINEDGSVEVREEDKDEFLNACKERRYDRLLQIASTKHAGWSRYKVVDSKTKDGVFSELASGEYKNGFLRVMTKTEYDNAKRNGRLATTGSLFKDYNKAKKYIEFLKADETYVIVNMINGKVDIIK